MYVIWITWQWSSWERMGILTVNTCELRQQLPWCNSRNDKAVSTETPTNAGIMAMTHAPFHVLQLPTAKTHWHHNSDTCLCSSQMVGWRCIPSQRCWCTAGLHTWRKCPLHRLLSGESSVHFVVMWEGLEDHEVAWFWQMTCQEKDPCSAYYNASR